jgi:hypothetical protein
LGRSIEVEPEHRANVYRFDESPAARAERLRKEARGTPAGVKRDELPRRALRIENEARVNSPTGEKSAT